MIGFTPAYMIQVAGQNVTSLFSPYLLSIECTDEEGTQSDTAKFVLDDPGGRIALPRLGDPAAVALGYLETGVYPMGRYTVADVSAAGFPRQVSISCKSADTTRTKKQKRTKSYVNKPLKDVLGEIAKRHGRTLKIVGDFEGLTLPSWHQDDESDLHFVDRLGREFDANASWKGGQLIFVKKGLLPPGVITIGPTDLLQGGAYELDIKGRSKNKGAKGSNWNRRKAKRETHNEGGGTGTSIAGGGKYHHGGESHAKATAKAEADRNKRDEKNLSLNCIGNPLYMAEFELIVAGVREGVDGHWRIKKAHHSMTSTSYSTKLDAELPGK